MKARLLHRDREFDWQGVLAAAAAREAQRTGRRPAPGPAVGRPAELPWNAEALTADLGLTPLLDAMAGDDDCVFEAARTVLLAGVTGDVETIRYRQAVLQDCLAHPAVVRALYAIAVEAGQNPRGSYLGVFTRYPDSVLRDALDALGTFLGFLRRLRGIADEHARAFVSEGWTAFFATLARELDDGYLARVERDLEELRFPRGVRLSAELGPGHKGRRYTLHRVPPRTWRWRDWWRGLFAEKPPAYRFELPPRDEAGAQALGALRNRGLALAATALAQAADHVRAFFGMLRAELAFYVGCLNLHDALAARGVPVCVPLPAPAEARRWACRGLRDAGLALIGERGVVGNTVRADGKTLVLITGPNSGGKSTFLRSVGLAQLMMQAGMFVPAEAFEASVCDGLFTHFKREEDARMERGKLDEELHRMSEIVDRLTARSVLLCNESFEATNEREGSEIARQIVRALVEAGVRVFVVTHLFDLAHGFAVRAPGPALFLRAERQPDGRRTFRMLEGEPLPTSYGEDVYARVFGTPASAALLAPAAGARRA